MTPPADSAAMKAGLSTVSVGTATVMGLTPDQWVAVASIATVIGAVLTSLLTVMRMSDWWKARRKQ